jgi:hypothetical protein
MRKDRHGCVPRTGCWYVARMLHVAETVVQFRGTKLKSSGKQGRQRKQTGRYLLWVYENSMGVATGAYHQYPGGQKEPTVVRRIGGTSRAHIVPEGVLRGMVNVRKVRPGGNVGRMVVEDRACGRARVCLEGASLSCCLGKPRDRMSGTTCALCVRAASEDRGEQARRAAPGQEPRGLRVQQTTPGIGAKCAASSRDRPGCGLCRACGCIAGGVGRRGGSSGVSEGLRLEPVHREAAGVRGDAFWCARLSRCSCRAGAICGAMGPETNRFCLAECLPGVDSVEGETLRVRRACGHHGDVWWTYDSYYGQGLRFYARTVQKRHWRTHERCSRGLSGSLGLCVPGPEQGNSKPRHRGNPLVGRPLCANERAGDCVVGNAACRVRWTAAGLAPYGSRAGRAG